MSIENRISKWNIVDDNKKTPERPFVQVCGGISGQIKSHSYYSKTQINAEALQICNHCYYKSIQLVFKDKTGGNYAN